MTHAIEPFEFSEHQFSQLSPHHEYAVKKLVYMRTFQEWVYITRQRNGWPISVRTDQSNISAETLKVHDPWIRDEIAKILGNLQHPRRQWITFTYIFTKFDRITRPTYFPKPTKDDLKRMHAMIVAKPLKLMIDGKEISLSPRDQDRAIRMLGEPLYDNGSVVVNGGKRHVTMILMPGATLDDVQDVFSVVTDYQEILLGKRKHQGEKDLDWFYEIAKLYRRGMTRTSTIRHHLFEKWETEHPDASEKEGDRMDKEYNLDNINNWIREAKNLRFL